MSTKRKFPVKAGQIPVRMMKTDELLGFVGDVALEVTVDAATGSVTLSVPELWVSPAPPAAAEQAELLAELDAAGPDSDPALAVWTTYVEEMKPRNAALDPETRKHINNALKVASVVECQDAIRGCKSSGFHMGQNDRRKKYNRITQILKGRSAQGTAPARTTRETIDFFLDLLAKSGQESRVTSVDAARLRHAKQDVRDALEFPGDETVVERGRKAKAWLVEMGFQVTKEGERVIFTPPS